MTEKEKCAEGLLYNANYDQQLLQEMIQCKDMCHRYNQLFPSQIEEKTALIRKLFGKTEEDFTILTPFWCDYGYNIEIGNHFFANHNCVILDGTKVKFGDFVFIAPNCCFTTAGHPIDAKQRNEGLEFAYPITVGDHVWFGANVTVMPGVTIGENSIIGAGSVVTKDIPANVIAIGSPCVVLREITESDKQKYRKRN